MSGVRGRIGSSLLDQVERILAASTTRPLFCGPVATGRRRSVGRCAGKATRRRGRTGLSRRLHALSALLGCVADRSRRKLLRRRGHVRKKWVRRHAQQRVQTDDQRAALAARRERTQVNAKILGFIRRKAIRELLSGKGNATCESENTPFGYCSPSAWVRSAVAPASTTRSTASSVPSPAFVTTVRR